MSAAWRLAINNLSGRHSRTLLLTAAVALSSSLIAAVSCALASLDLALLQRAKATLGGADLRVHHVGGATFDESAVQTIRSWPEVATAIPRLRDSLALRTQRTAGEAAVMVFGVEPRDEPAVRAFDFVAGRLMAAPDEVVIDENAARLLQARVGDRLDVVRFGDPVSLLVVGVIRPPPLGIIVEREETFVTLGALRDLVEKPARLTEIDILLKPGFDPAAVAQARRAPLAGGPAQGAADTILQLMGQPPPGGGSRPNPAADPTSPPALARPDALKPGLMVQATAKVTSGLQKNMESNKIGLVMASILSFIAASFIIMTGLTTAVTERVRELAILRCIGAFRRQLAAAQLLVGVLIGIMGGLVGAPLGAALAYALVAIFPDQLPGGFAMSWFGIGLALGAAGASGVVGAAWPALHAARTSPLEGLALRSRSPAIGWVWACLLAAPVLLAVHAGAMLLLGAGSSHAAYTYTLIGLGLPALMAGYFVLAVPLTIALARGLGPPISRALGLPGRVMERTVTATPFRHGFTAGAMMLGLALMVAIWTNGRAVMRDWLEALALPDAFIYGPDLRPASLDRIAAIPGVEVMCPITRQTVNLDADKAQGLTGVVKFNTYFFGFEPEPFFKMTRVVWEEGDQATAVARLTQGGAVLVERSFKTARGVGVGQTVNIHHNGRTYPFEVVGVISSPGLDIASKFMEVGEQFIENAVNSVFGSRDDMIRVFGNDAINFVQMSFAPGTDGKEALRQAREAAGGGVLLAILAIDMKDRIREVISAALVVFSTIGIGAMLVACFSVANLIVAGIHTRQFEFGVLRAVGAQRGLLGRLVMGEAIIIAVAACLLGTAMGLQAAWGETQVYKALLGLTIRPAIYLPPIAVGWGAVAAITLGAAGPAVWRLVRKPPRELLAAVKG